MYQVSVARMTTQSTITATVPKMDHNQEAFRELVCLGVIADREYSSDADTASWTIAVDLERIDALGYAMILSSNGGGSSDGGDTGESYPVFIPRSQLNYIYDPVPCWSRSVPSSTIYSFRMATLSTMRLSP